ncbi:hypothetical protein BDR05DRAFT_1005037 [Suillus weaverae]|nr:hypothetical protein BDR05DRAFT_1005037 [Suillus weaverae]
MEDLTCLGCRKVFPSQKRLSGHEARCEADKLLDADIYKSVQSSGANPLHILFGYEEWTDDWLDLAHLLVKAGCPIDIEDDKGDTPLCLAIRHGSSNLLTHLIASGAHIPLDAIHDHLEDYWVDRSVIHTLIQHGADVNVVRNEADALHALLAHENWRDDWLRIAQLLIEAGCSIDAEDGEGCTPLRLAIRCTGYRQKDISTWLIILKV